MAVSNIFYFHPYLGKIPILTNIFQVGWNHQLLTLPCKHGETHKTYETHVENIRNFPFGNIIFGSGIASPIIFKRPAASISRSTTYKSNPICKTFWHFWHEKPWIQARNWTKNPDFIRGNFGSFKSWNWDRHSDLPCNNKHILDCELTIAMYWMFWVPHQKLEKLFLISPCCHLSKSLPHGQVVGGEEKGGVIVRTAALAAMVAPKLCVCGGFLCFFSSP